MDKRLLHHYFSPLTFATIGDFILAEQREECKYTQAAMTAISA